MSEPEKRIRNGKVRWYARYRDPSGRRVTRVFDRRLDAANFLTGVANAKMTGTYLDPAQSKIKTGDWADRWLEGQGHLKQGARARYEGIVRRYVKPRWGTTPINRVSHSDVQAWISELAGSGLSASSVRHAHRVMHLVMELAVRDGRIARNPAHGVKLPKLPKTTKRFLTREEVWRLADAAGRYPVPGIGEQYRTLVLLLSYTGLRWGEAAGLKVGRLELMNRRLTVAETLIDDKTSGALRWDTPKSHAQREVYFAPFLADLLAEVVAGKGPEETVFTSARGRLLSNGNFRRYVWDPAVRDAGLAPLVPHELRHTAASLAVSSGANVKVVMRMLGHRSAAMTLDVYSGLFDADLEGVAERMEGAPSGYRSGTEPTEADVIPFPK